MMVVLDTAGDISFGSEPVTWFAQWHGALIEYGTLMIILYVLPYAAEMEGRVAGCAGLGQRNPPVTVQPGKPEQHITRQKQDEPSSSSTS